MNFLDLEKLKRYTTKMFSYIDRKIKNQVETLGNSDNIKIPDSKASELGIPTGSNVTTALSVVKNEVEQIGDLRMTTRSSLGSKWFLANGAGFSQVTYPDLQKIVDPSMSTWLNKSTSVSQNLKHVNGYRVRFSSMSGTLQGSATSINVAISYYADSGGVNSADLSLPITTALRNVIGTSARKYEINLINYIQASSIWCICVNISSDYPLVAIWTASSINGTYSYRAYRNGYYVDCNDGTVIINTMSGSTYTRPAISTNGYSFQNIGAVNGVAPNTIASYSGVYQFDNYYYLVAYFSGGQFGVITYSNLTQTGTLIYESSELQSVGTFYEMNGKLYYTNCYADSTSGVNTNGKTLLFNGPTSAPTVFDPFSNYYSKVPIPYKYNNQQYILLLRRQYSSSEGGNAYARIYKVTGDTTFTLQATGTQNVTGVETKIGLNYQKPGSDNIIYTGGSGREFTIQAYLPIITLTNANVFIKALN